MTDFSWEKQDSYTPNDEWKSGRFFNVIGGQWVEQDVVVSVANPQPIPDNCLTFSSAEPLTIAVSSGEKSWNGNMYYSTDAETWNEWDGTTISSAKHGTEQRLYLRGSGNTIVTTAYVWNTWEYTGDNIRCVGNIENLLDYEMVANGEHPPMGTEYCFGNMFLHCPNLIEAPELPSPTLNTGCYSNMFANCTKLEVPPSLPATTLAGMCYQSMFHGCTSLKVLPKLPATNLPYVCYSSMFEGCTNIKLSETQSDEYPNEYRIPTSGTGTRVANSVMDMFKDTGGTFTGKYNSEYDYVYPELNKFYYTSNTVV